MIRIGIRIRRYWWSDEGICVLNRWVIINCLLIGLVAADSGLAVPQDDSVSFERYRGIITRKPFGEPPPAPQAPAPVFKPEDSFAKDLTMCALLDDSETGIRIGLVNKKTKNNFYLSIGDTEDGIELVSANWDDEEAVLRKGSEMAVVKLQSGVITPLSPAEQQTMKAKSKRLSYAERRKARQEARKRPPRQVEPKLKGAALEQHLKEYQMEVIRQGLPPLPIPLTKDMDDQLVSEGVLPPQ